MNYTRQQLMELHGDMKTQVVSNVRAKEYNQRRECFELTGIPAWQGFLSDCIRQLQCVANSLDANCQTPEDYFDVASDLIRNTVYLRASFMPVNDADEVQSLDLAEKGLRVLAVDSFDAAYGIMKAKNQDYSGATSDPFSNFNASPIIGVQPEKGLLMRVIDKFQRIKSFGIKGELMVKGESVLDALLDTLNYMVLLVGLIQSKQEKPDGQPVSS